MVCILIFLCLGWCIAIDLSSCCTFISFISKLNFAIVLIFSFISKGNFSRINFVLKNILGIIYSKGLSSMVFSEINIVSTFGGFARYKINWSVIFTISLF